ncbi:membrane protein [Pelistega indica]|uniref:Membrane protein n=1 Tax=Pelistega indica TaxID=1414851 RepID=V8FY53_9BURK|nr:MULTISPECIES: DMT family transporter [Pelistega]ETD69204.1 membrane protein [Pelistega indica]
MTQQSSSHIGIHLRLIGMAILWGTSWAWGRVVAQHMPPITGSTYRFIIASLSLLIWLYSVDRFKSIRDLTAKQWLGLIGTGATGIFAYSLFFMTALQWLPAGKASAVIALNPAFTLLLAAWLFKEKLNLQILLGIGLAIFGSLYAISQGNPLKFLSGNVGLGEYLLLGCVLSWVSYTLIGRAVIGGIPALTATTVGTCVGAILLFITSIFVDGAEGWQRAIHAPFVAHFSAIGMALGATTLAFSWFFNGVKTLGAGNAAAYIALVPVFGILISALWLGEPLHSSLIIGVPLAITGMMIMNKGQKK